MSPKLASEYKPKEIAALIFDAERISHYQLESLNIMLMHWNSTYRELYAQEDLVWPYIYFTCTERENIKSIDVYQDGKLIHRHNNNVLDWKEIHTKVIHYLYRLDLKEFRFSDPENTPSYNDMFCPED